MTLGEGITTLFIVLLMMRFLIWALSVAHKRYDTDTVENLETELKRLKEIRKERERRRN